MLRELHYVWIEQRVCYITLCYVVLWTRLSTLCGHRWLVVENAMILYGQYIAGVVEWPPKTWLPTQIVTVKCPSRSLTCLSNFDIFHQFATQPNIIKKLPTVNRNNRERFVGAWNEATPTMLSRRRTMRPKGVETALRNGPIRVKIGESQTIAAIS